MRLVDAWQIAGMASDAVECAVLARRLAIRLTNGLTDSSLSTTGSAGEGCCRSVEDTPCVHPPMHAKCFLARV